MDRRSILGNLFHRTTPREPADNLHHNAIDAGALAEQRHTYRDLDPDSRWQPTDRQLCDHGHPLGTAFTDCSECISFQYRRHTEDWQPISDIRFCRRCGLTSGTHAAGLL